jgi:guanine nucleotide-binding protein G(i) subunit alpha
MGACGSTESGRGNGGEDMEQKKKSQAIDKKLEEDARKFRRECKILLLGNTSI